ncbi:MAG: S41 family peptidase [Clostridia bacterium]|nr:S41 family peptidase [Clostridia bacterium]
MFDISKKTLAVIALMFAAFTVILITVYITTAVVGGTGSVDGADISARQETLEERYGRLDEVYEIIMEEYYQEPDSEALLLGAIDGMLNALDDPYTFYYTVEEMTESKEESEGIYFGVGMLVSSDQNGNLTVLRVFKDSPAQKSGVLPGDIIIAANGEKVSAETVEKMNEAVDKIKGSENTEVMLTILRRNEEIDIPVMRGDITVNRVEYEILEGNIGYVMLYEFFGDAADGVREAFDAFKLADVDGVIFDVRSNAGGQLDICLEISDMILPEGKITYIEDRQGRQQNYYSDSDKYNFPMVFLINEMSASASELLTAAVQEYDVATVVGTRSYGKGIVQTLREFNSDHAGIQLTTASYFTPNGVSIHKTGVTPDIEVEMWDQYDSSVFHPDLDNDNQLKVAYDTLMEMIQNQDQ